MNYRSRALIILGLISSLLIAYGYCFLIPHVVGKFTACDPNIEGILFKKGYAPYWISPGVHLKLRTADAGRVVFQQNDIVDYVMHNNIPRFYCAEKILFSDSSGADNTVIFDTSNRKELPYVDIEFPVRKVGQNTYRTENANPIYRKVSLTPLEINWASGFSSEGWHVQ